MFIRHISTSFALLVLLSLSMLNSVNAQQINVEGLRFSDTTDLARIVIEFDAEPSYSYFSLANPHRFVVDLPKVDKDFDPSTVQITGNKVITIRHSTPKSPNDTRLVIETTKKLNPRLFTLAPYTIGDEQLGHRLVIELNDPDPIKMPDQTQSVAPDNKIVSNQAPVRDKDIIIVIDAGHGGVDPGSIGPSKTYEKNITLSIAKMLAKRINAEPGLRAVLTRESDYYLKPGARSKIAVEENADLLVSIHADAFTSPQPRGGSVWVLSTGRADSELGRLIEQTERRSEMLGPAANVIEDRNTELYFAETILNMSMELFRAKSHELSNEIIKDLKQVTRMHKKTPQSASLAVLTASEFPSILVEVGFISNPQEEKNLNWSKYREKLAQAMYTSIVRFFRNTPPDGTLWAIQKNAAPIKHTVARGESLSLIAQRYSVSVRELKTYNNLNSDLLRIGQVLSIPKK